MGWVDINLKEKFSTIIYKSSLKDNWISVTNNRIKNKKASRRWLLVDIQESSGSNLAD